MSKSRGNLLDPKDIVAALGADGARYVALREVPVRPRHRSVLGLVRPPLQRRPRERLRQPRQPHAVDDGRAISTATGPRRATASDAPSPAAAWAALADAYARSHRRLPAARRACAPLGVRRRGEPLVDAEQPWVLAKAAKAGDAEADRRLRDVLGDLLEACRLVALRGRAGHARDGAARLADQLGLAYPYGPTATAVLRSTRCSSGEADPPAAGSGHPARSSPVSRPRRSCRRTPERPGRAGSRAPRRFPRARPGGSIRTRSGRRAGCRRRCRCRAPPRAGVGPSFLARRARPG